jgi:hemolysin activation/secretion protein
VIVVISHIRRHLVRRILGSVGFCVARRQPSVVGNALLTLALVLALTPHPAAAQQARLPQTDVRQPTQQFEREETERQRAKSTDVPLPKVPKADTNADTQPLFELTGVTIEGATLLSRAALAEAWRPYIGKTVSQADLVAIAGKISDLYRAAGYHLSRAIVPPQDIEGGRVKIKVIEGRIVDIVVKGERVEKFGVRKLLAPIAAERVSRGATMERQLLLVNDLPGVRIADSAIEEIGTTTGRFRLIVTIESWSIFTQINLDNRGTAAIGPPQAFWATNFNSTLVSGDTLGVNFATVPSTPEELGFARLFYWVPIGIDGARIGAIGTYGEQRPGDIRSQIDTVDRSGTFDLRGSIVPIRTKDSSLWLSAGFGIGEFYEDTIFGPNFRDHIRAVNATADYQLHDGLDAWNYLTVSIRQGLPIFGASARGDPFLSRFDGSGTFSKLTAYYTRYQPLVGPWSVKLAFAGQIASTALLASEEFYLGSAFGRGFWGLEFSGDNAVGGSAELRFDQTFKNDFIKGYQLYGYVDDTMAWNFHSNGAELVLALAGLGVRFYLPYDLQLGIEAAYPMEYHTPPIDQPREVRGFFYVTKTYKLCPGSAQLRCS